MNILEIIWVVLTFIGLIYSIKAIKNDNPWGASIVILTAWSLMIMIGYYIDNLTTPLW